MIETMIQQLGRELEMEEVITSPEPGHYIVPFDEGLQIELTQSPLGYYVYRGVIGPYPKKNPEPFTQRLMEMNLFGKGTYGAAIGLNEEGNVLTLCLELDYNSSYKEFRNKLEDFLNVLEFWRKEVVNLK